MYNTGTISTTSGSNIVTGAGTVWSTNINAGDVLILPVGASGKLYRVFNVDSDTQITLWGNISYTVSSSPYELGTDFTTSTILTSSDIAVANVYATSGLAGLAKTGLWNDVQDKPTEFTPSVHTHTESDITDLDKYGQVEVDNKLATKADDNSISVVGKTGGYGDLLEVPSEFPPAAHAHVESDITNLDKYGQVEVDNKLSLKADDSSISTVGKTGSYNDLLNKPDLSVLEEVLVYDTTTNFPTTGETGKVYITQDTGYMYRWSGTDYVQLTDQTAIWGQVSGDISNQTDLQNALVDKSDVGHTHLEADITNLDKYSQSEVDNKLAIKADDNSISTVGKTGSYGDLLEVPNEFPPSAHTHTESDITDLDKYTTAQTDNLLAGKWDKQAVVQSSAFTAQVNTRYWLTGTGDVTLPTSAGTGDIVELNKSGGTVLINGQIVYDGTTDTSLEWDLETKLGLVWTGSAWSVQLA